MIFDGNWQFSGTAGVAGSTDNVTTGTQFSTNVVDLGPGNRDLGIGDDPAIKIAAVVINTFTGGTSLQVNLQGSTDNLVWTTMVFGPVIAEANLTTGVHLFDIDLARVVGALMEKPGASQALPRYLRLSYVSVGTHSAGGLFAAGLLDRHDHNDNYPSSHSQLFPSGV